MPVRNIDYTVLKNPKSDIEDVYKYLTHVARRNDSNKLSALWDEADDQWKPIVAKFWGKLNDGRNLFMVKVEQGKAKLVEREEEIVTIGDDATFEASDDPDAVVVDDTPAEPSEGIVIEMSNANARRRVHGSRK